MARHMSDLKQREIALREILLEAAWADHVQDPGLRHRSPLEFISWYDDWKLRARTVLEQTRRSGRRNYATG